MKPVRARPLAVALTLIILVGLVVTAGGCGLARGLFTAFRRPGAMGIANGGHEPISPSPDGTPVRLELYFAGAETESLRREERTVIQRGESPAELAIGELIKGPASEGLLRTLPRETKLLSLQVVEGVAYVNFSREIQTRHPGGSIGEQLTMQSVAHTLAASNPGITSVQLLIEGKVEEAIWGHGVTSEPIVPSSELVN